MMTTHMKVVQQRFADEERVAILSHSIDPENDSPEVLSTYAEAHGIDGRRWKLLTGESETVFALAKGYKVRAFDDSFGGERELIHDGTFVLLDERRRIRGYYDGLDIEDVGRLIDDIDRSADASLTRRRLRRRRR